MLERFSRKVQNCSCEAKTWFLSHKASALSWHTTHQGAMRWTGSCCFQVTLQMKPGVCCRHGEIYSNSGTVKWETWGDRGWMNQMVIHNLDSLPISILRSIIVRIPAFLLLMLPILSKVSLFWGFDCILNCYSEKQYKQINAKTISFSNLATYFSI